MATSPELLKAHTTKLHALEVEIATAKKVLEEKERRWKVESEQLKREADELTTIAKKQSVASKKEAEKMAA